MGLYFNALQHILAEREGFEPSIRYKRIHTFQACSFSHSDTSPELVASLSANLALILCVWNNRHGCSKKGSGLSVWYGFDVN